MYLDDVYIKTIQVEAYDQEEAWELIKLKVDEIRSRILKGEADDDR